MMTIKCRVAPYLCAAIALFAIQLGRLHAVSAPTITWTGASNNQWSVAANWNPQRLPNSADVVEIATGTNVQLNVSTTIATLILGQTSGTATQTLVLNAGQTLVLGTAGTINSRGVLNFSAGQIGGAGLLAIDGRFDWTGGQIKSRILVQSGGALKLSGTSPKQLFSDDANFPAALTNRGLVVWSSAQPVTLGNATRVINGDGGTWRLEADGSPFNNAGGAQSLFLNQGTLIKAAGTNNAVIDGSVLFTNQATVVAQSAPFAFTGVANFARGGQLDGPFPIRLENTSTFVETTLNTVVELVSGTLNGDVTLAGNGPVFNWRGGRITRSLTIPPGGVLNLVGLTPKQLYSDDSNFPAALTNRGLVVWSSAPPITLGNATRVINGDGGTWRLEADGSPFNNAGGVQSLFLNQGTLIKAAGTNNAVIDGSVLFTNQATVVAQSAPFAFTGVANFARGGQLDGPFPIRLENTSTFVETTLNTVVELVSGRLNGDVTMAGNGPVFNWRGGHITGSLTIPPGGVLNLVGLTSKQLYSDDANFPAALTNRGLVVWSSAPQITLGNATRVINGDGGTWRLEADGSPFNNAGGLQSLFLNQGTLIKAAGTNDAVIDGSLLFINQAVISARSNSFTFTGSADFGPGSQLDGPFPVRFAGAITVSGILALNTSLELTGGALFGNVTFSGPGPVFNWSGGHIRRSLTIPTGGILNLLGSAGKLLYSDDANSPVLLTNRGLVSWRTTQPITVANATRIINESGATWRLEQNGSPFNNAGGPPSSFINRGTLTKAASGGTAVFDSLTFANDGTLQALSGTLQLPGGTVLGSQSQVLLSLSGTNGTNLGVINIAGAGTLGGVLAARLENGFVPQVGDQFVALRGTPLTGSFAGASLPALPPDRAWFVDQLSTQVKLIVEPVSSCIPLSSNLVFWLRGENGFTDSIRPHSVQGLNGTTLGAGRVGQGMAFDGVDDYVAVLDAPDLRMTNLTVEGWFRFNNLNGIQVLVSKPLGGNNLADSFAIWVNNGQLRARISDREGDSSGVLSNPTLLAADVWYHLAATFDDESDLIALYTNGVLAASAPETRSIRYARYPWTIGGDYRDGVMTSFFVGRADEVAFHNRALSAAALRDIYSSGQVGRCTDGLPVFPPPVTPSCTNLPPGLITWLPGEGTFADVTGNHHGVALGNPGFTNGLVGQGMRFDGQDDQVLFGPWFTNQLFTFSMWVKPDFGQTFYANILDNNHTGSRGFVFQYNNTGNQYVFGTAPGGGFTPDVIPGVWQHIAFTREPGYVNRLYINGELQGSVTNAAPISWEGAQFLRLGNWGGGGRHWKGALDEFQIYDRALSSNEVASIAIAAAGGTCPGTNVIPACVPAPSGLAGWWTGDYTADSAIGGEGALLLNGTTFDRGLVNGAFRLDGNDDLISIGNVPALQSATGITVMAWVAKLADNHIGGIIGKWDTGENSAENSYLLFNGEDAYLGNGGAAFQFSDGSASVVAGSNRMPAGVWVHLAATWDATTGQVRLYKNGILESSVPGGLGQTLRYHTAYTAKIGEWGKNNRPNSRWNGLIDEPMIFNRALSAEEISSLAGSASTGVCRPVPVTPGSPVIADSVTDFSGAQGGNNWFYGYYDRTADPDGTYQSRDFIPFPRGNGPHSSSNFWTGTQWDWFAGNPPWTEVRASSAHPNGLNNGVEHWAIRRWISEVVGNVTVRFHIAKSDVAAGNGVTGRLFLNGVERFSKSIAFNESQAATNVINLTGVAVGDVLDFALDPRGADGLSDDRADSSIFTAAIEVDSGVPTRGLQGYWTFDDPANPGRDSSPNGSELTAVGAPTVVPGGVSGLALSLGGNGDFLSATNFPLGIPVGNSTYTISAWIKPNATGYRGIVGWGNYGSIRQTVALRLGNGANDLYHYWWGSDLTANAAPADLFDGCWHHVAVTFDGYTRTLLADGATIGSDLPGGNNAAAANFTIGKTYGNEYFSGQLDEVRIYNRALSSAELSALTSSGRPNACASAPPAVALWLRSDQGVVTNASGRVTTWLDQSGGGHHATAANPPLFAPAGLNGRPTVRFENGGAQSFDLAGSIITNQQFTIVAVVTDQGGGSHREIISNWRSDNTFSSLFFGTTGDNPTRARLSDDFSAGGVGAIPSPNQPFILTGVNGTTTVRVLHNRDVLASRGTLLSSRNLSTPWTLGRQGGLAGEYWTGDIAEVLVFNSALSTLELATVWSYLESKYLTNRVVANYEGALAFWQFNTGDDLAASPQNSSLGTSGNFTLGVPVTPPLPAANADNRAAVEGPGSGNNAGRSLGSEGNATSSEELVRAAAGSLTVFARVLFPQFNDVDDIVRMGDWGSTTRDIYALEFENGSARFSLLGAGASTETTLRHGSILSANRWYDVSGVYDATGRTMTVYVFDATTGQPVGAPAVSGSLSFAELNSLPGTLKNLLFLESPFDANGNNGGPNGGVQLEVAGIWDRALSAAEIAALSRAGGTGGNAPDLVIASVAAPASAIMGQTISLVYRLENRGNATAFGPWRNQFVSAADSSGQNLQQLGSASFTSELPPGGSVVLTQSVILPGGVFGPRYLGVVADFGNAVAELVETNNAAYTTTFLSIQAADLVPTNFVAAGSARFGDTINATFTVANTGTAAANSPGVARVFLAATSNSLAGASQLASVTLSNLPSGASQSYTQALAVPLLTGAAPGAYALVLVVDADNTQAESNEGNNQASRALSLAYPPLPDLAISKVNAPEFLLAGLAANISWSVTNRGDLEVNAAWSEVVAISNAVAGVRSLGEWRFTNSLGTGEFLNRTQSVIIPTGLSAGTWTVQVTVDSRNEIFEQSEANNTSSATNRSQIPAELTIQLPVSEVNEGGPEFVATITRNGDISQPLTVTVTNSHSRELAMTNQVVIPAGSRNAGLVIRPLLDGLVDGNQFVTVGVSATDYQGSSQGLTVRDVDVPRLFFTIASPSVTEGMTVAATLTRDYALNRNVTVVLSAADPTQITVPTSVIIPSNQASVTFSILAVDDTLIEPLQTNVITAEAAGFQKATAWVVIVDNDMPAVTLLTAAPSISEGAGPLATTATIRRDPATSRSMTLRLESSQPGSAQVPATVTIPGGQASASFPIAAVDNQIVDGTRNVTIRAFVLDSVGTVLAQAAATSLEVTDDDGPTLKLKIAQDVIAEGLATATTATVTRNTETTAALVVSLQSSDTTEVTVPSSVTIPVGAFSATFDLATPLDGITDGNQTAIITASAPQFTSGSDIVIVSDIDLPDFVVTSVNAPTNGLTEGNFSIRYRVENRGIAASTRTFRTRIFLSDDAFAGGDTLLGEFPFEGTLPVGQFIEQTAQFRLPNTSGRYWLIIVADAASEVPEVLESNNTYVSPLPLTVDAAYTATVETPVTVGLAGTPVPMTGRAVQAGSGLPAANALVHIRVQLRGTERVLAVETDLNGNFTATFTPLPGEAGIYQIAATHPGAPMTVAQDTFTLNGVRLAVAQGLTVTEGSSVTGRVMVINLGEAPLQSVAASVVNAPANVSVELRLLANSLPALSSNLLQVVVRAQDASVTTADVTVRVTTSEGASDELVIPVRVESLQARLIAIPENLYAGMLRGSQSSVDFQIANLGGVTSGPVVISIPNAPWLRVGSTNPLPPLAPFSTNTVTLLLTPADDLPLGPYTGTLSVSAGNAPALAIPFEFRAISEAKGSLRVVAVDEFTYYAEGSPKVSNAVVVVRDGFSRALVANGVTDANGQALFHNLPEGTYEVEVTEKDHSKFVGAALLRGGRTNYFEPFLARQTVQYRWTVVPTTVEDRTRIVIETTFETFVPAPVITIEPALIDLAGFNGSVTQINLTVSNHGLVAGQEFKLNFPDHPDYTFTPLVTDLGKIPAMSRVDVPLVIRRKVSAGQVAKSAKSTGGGGCGISAGGCWTLPCGPRKNSYCATVAIVNVGAGCGQIASVPGGGSNGGVPYVPLYIPPPNGGPGSSPVVVNANGPYLPERSFEPPKICDCDPNDFEEKCLEIPLSSSALNAALDAVASALSKIPNLSVEAKAEAKVKLCNCCDDDGMGFKVEGGGSVTFDGKLSIPLLGITINKSFQQNGYDVEVEATLGCPYEQGVTVTATIDGKTECHLKNPEVCGGFSLDLPASIPCAIGATIVLKQGGQEKFRQALTVGATLSYGLSGSFQYCRDSKGSKTSGEICGKGLKLEAALDFTALGQKFNPKLEQVLVEANCLQFGSGSLHGEQIAAEAEVKFQEGMRKSRGTAAAHSLATAAAKGIPAPAAARAAADEEAGVCARVKLQLDQEFVLARNAFNATLELDNISPAGPLTDISVSVLVVDETGRAVDERFAVRPPVLTGINAVDGTGVIPASSKGTISFILIPTSEAAPAGPTRYGVGGVLTYRQDGRQITVPLFPAPITVYPDPRLSVKYFHERNVYADDPFTRDVVEPSVPYNLAVMVDNHGAGTAKNVRITSSQPKIIENEKGLLIDFKIIGTEVAGQPQSPSLTVNFGEIAPGDRVIGRWLFTSTLQGLFLDYSARFEHLDSFGKTNLSLIDDVTIHEMIHLVQAQGALEDGKPDFLVNDIADPDDMPDRIYLSNGATNRVEVVREAVHSGPPTASQLTVSLTAQMPQGWTYLDVPDPAGSSGYVLARVVRSDGREVYLGTNVWVTDRTFIGRGKRPLNERKLHLLDDNSTGRYTLHYQLPPPTDTNPPVTQVLAMPARSYGDFMVRWDGVDASGAVASFDIYVSVDGGAYALWLQNTSQRSGLYQGQTGRRYAFYSVGVDAKGNREAAPLEADAMTIVDLENRPPVITLVSNVVIDEGQTLLLTPVVTDPDPDQTVTFSLGAGAPAGVVLNGTTGQLSWPTAEANGPSTNLITILVRDNGQPPLTATATVVVLVNEVNVAPVLPGIAIRRINELQPLTIVLGATDSDLPGQRLTYSFGSTPPRGASLNATTGIFSWTPDSTQGPTTNSIVVIVRDDGSPSLSATQTFLVIVRDSGADFAVGFGSTNLFGGQSGVVPLRFQSGLDLTNMTLELRLTAAGLTNLTLSPAVGSVGSASIAPAGENRYLVRLVAGAGQVLEGAGEFARLNFETRNTGPSALIRLLPETVTGRRANGDSITGDGVQGRVIVINREPVLVGQPGAGGRLEVFGRLGASYLILTSPTVAGPWTPVRRVTLIDSISKTVALGNSGGSVFYRAIESGEPGTPILEATRQPGQIQFTLVGVAGTTYAIQSAATLNGPWTEETRVTLTGPSLNFTRPNPTTSVKFYRAVKP